MTDELWTYKTRVDEMREQLEQANNLLARSTAEESSLKTRFKTMWRSCTEARRDRDAYETDLRDDMDQLSDELDEALANVREKRRAVEQLNAAAREMAFGYGTYVRDTTARTKRLHAHTVRLAAELEASRSTERKLRAKLRPDDAERRRSAGCSPPTAFLGHGDNDCRPPVAATGSSWSSTNDYCGSPRKPNGVRDSFAELLYGQSNTSSNQEDMDSEFSLG